MVANLPRRVGRGGNSGGNNHPIAVKQFIQDHLTRVGEDCTSGIHQAYNQALNQLAKDRGRKFYYEHPVHSSIRRQIGALLQDGTIESFEREERMYFRLVR